jgi:RNA polymerase sigma factor (sigma-70 family)
LTTDPLRLGSAGGKTARASGEKPAAPRQDIFPTYFPWWVRQNILREIPFTANPSVYFPVHARDKLYSIYEIVEGHQCDECGQNGLCPNLLVEAADRLECSTSDAEPYLRYYRGYKSIEEMLSEDPLALSDHGSFETDFLESYNLKELEAIVVEVLETLTPKEKEIIKLRMGLLDGEEHTLEEVGSVYGVTRERIRQIEAKALQKLQHPSRSRRLIPFGMGREPNNATQQNLFFRILYYQGFQGKKRSTKQHIGPTQEHQKVPFAPYPSRSALPPCTVPGNVSAKDTQ